jgi:hypothetical protein
MPGLKTQTVEFQKTWNDLKEDIWTILKEPFNLKPKLGWTQLQFEFFFFHKQSVMVKIF